MKLGKNFSPIGKPVYKGNNVKGIITDVINGSVFEVEFKDDEKLKKQYSISAFLRNQLSTDDKELSEYITKYICIENLKRLGISHEYIDCFRDNDSVFLFQGRTAKEITAEGTPELYLKIKGLEKRKHTKIFGVLNVPTKFAEDSDTFAFLDAELFKIYPPVKEGNTISATIWYWNIEFGWSGEKRQRFQLSNGGIWCMPFYR